MFDLDIKIGVWRRDMIAAGILTDKVLDELECHLRDDIDRAVKAGATLEAAFAAAIEKLGPPPALRREFEAGAPEPIASLWRRPIPAFPTDMRRVAFAALFFGPMLVLGAIQTLAINWIFFAPAQLAKEHYLPSFGLFLALYFLFGVLGLTSAIGYLWKPVYRFARPLAEFWVFFGWSLCSLLLSVFGQVGFPFVIRPLNIFTLLSIAVALVVYECWKRILRGDFNAANRSLEPDVHLRA